IVIAVVMMVSADPTDHVAHPAHLGGLLAGAAWVKLGWHRDYVQIPGEGLLSRWFSWRPFQNRPRKRPLIKAGSFKTSGWSVSKPEPVEVPEKEFISREVDPILDKISAHGIQSLTDQERKILEAAQKKMAKGT